MLTSNDLQLLTEKKISETGLQEQLDRFVQGFPFLEIKASASIAKGIRAISDKARQQYTDRWNAYLAQNKKILTLVLTYINVFFSAKASQSNLLNIKSFSILKSFLSV